MGAITLTWTQFAESEQAQANVLQLSDPYLIYGVDEAAPVEMAIWEKTSKITEI